MSEFIGAMERGGAIIGAGPGGMAAEAAFTHLKTSPPVQAS
jgi:cation diffusion facilitator CzcD-associated flavoprotein CzcO